MKKPINLNIPLLVLLSGLYLLTGINRPIDPYDEGVILTGAALVADGGLPYRDFWTTYAPGQFLVVGKLFSIFGKSMLAFRLYDLLIKLGVVLLLIIIALRLNNKTAAIITASIASLWLERMGLIGYTIFPAILAILATLVLIDSKKFILAGCTLFLVGVFRHDFAVYFTFVILLQILHSKEILKTFLVSCLLSCISILYLSSIIPWQTLYLQLWHFPVHVFPAHMSLPFLNLFGNTTETMLVALFPFLILLLSALSLDFKNKNLLTMLWLTTLILLMQVRVRSDLPHLLPSFLLVLPLFSNYLSSTLGKRDISSIARNALASVFLLLLIGIALKSKIQVGIKTNESLTRLVSSKVSKEYEQVEKQLLSECSHSLFILPTRGLRKARSDVASYFIWGVTPPTKYYEPHPGMFDSLEYEEQIIKELRDKNIQCILWANPYADNRPLQSDSPSLLEKTLNQSVVLTAYTGQYLTLEKVSLNSKL